MTIAYNDVFNAILSMDTYNRTENQGVNGLSGFQNTPIGDVKIIKVSELSHNTSYSFYAIAYQYTSGPNEGKVVISYRGTDNPVLDAITGWSVGAGITMLNQAPLAIQFFEDVVNSLSGSGGTYDIGIAPTSAQQTVLDKITLTGHSLGGGLAGYVASLSGSKAEVFDHMPFGVATISTYISEVASIIAASAEACAVLGVTDATPAGGGELYQRH